MSDRLIFPAGSADKLVSVLAATHFFRPLRHLSRRGMVGDEERIGTRVTYMRPDAGR